MPNYFAMAEEMDELIEGDTDVNTAWERVCKNNKLDAGQAESLMETYVQFYADSCDDEEIGKSSDDGEESTEEEDFFGEVIDEE